MGISAPLDTPFYSGLGTTSLVPGRFPVALNGHPYLVDSRPQFYRNQYVRATTPLLRQQADSSNLPGEQSISPAELWRRAQESWHRGAGQTHLDRPDSDEARFRSSKGVDVWTRWRLALLNDTASRLTSANTNLVLVSAGAYLYVTDGTALRFTSDITPSPPTWTAVTGLPAAAASAIATDGYDVWTAHGANGVYITTRGAAAATQYVSSALGATALVGYVKGRLMVASGPSLYNVTAGPIATPVISSTSTSVTGGTLAAGTYGYRVSATNANGETLASTEATQLTTGATSTVTVNWGAVTGAANYKVYGRTSGAELLLATVAGTLLTYTDTGSLTPAGALPVANTTGSLPTALFTSNNADWTWVGFAEGPNALYAAGYSGDRSLIYRTGIKTDATALDAPVVAGELPDGEIVRSIQGYLGYLVIGTDRGVRFAGITSAGDLQVGALIQTANPVRCFEPQDRFVWFGMTNYDGTSTGLGRLDLTQLTDTLTPAWATDLMATAQGNVTSVVSFQSRRVFTVAGSGVFAEDTANLVATGTLDSGLLSYNLPDPKVAMYHDLRFEALAGSITSLLSVDGASFMANGTVSAAGATATTFAVGALRGVSFETRLSLARATAATSTGPAVFRSTLRSYPAPSRGKTIDVPLMLYERESDFGDQDYPLDPLTELNFIDLLWSSGLPVTYQEGAASYQVLIDDYEWRPHEPTQSAPNKFWNGTLVLSLRVMPT